MEIKPTGFNFSRLLLTRMLTGMLMGIFVGMLLVFTPTDVQSQEEKQSQKKPLYISPSLQLGMHTKPAMDSPITALISSGTAVTLVKTSKDFSQVITEQGTQGWLKSKFLTEEEPATLKIKQLEQSLLEAQQQLQAQQNESQDEAEPAQSKMLDYEETIAGLKAEIKAWEQLDSQDKKANKEQADQINKHLKQRLLKIASLATGHEVNVSQLNLPRMTAVNETSDIVKLPFINAIKKDFLLNIVIGGICFFLGVFLMDLFNRRRHGGYRI